MVSNPRRGKATLWLTTTSLEFYVQGHRLSSPALTNPAPRDRGLRVVASTPGERCSFALPLRENKHFNENNHGEASEDSFAGPVSGLLNHFLLF